MPFGVDFGVDYVPASTKWKRFDVVASDLDNPDRIVTDGPIWEWQQTEAGKWVMEHAVETPSWHRIRAGAYYGYHYQIRADLRPEDATLFLLKWNKPD